MANWTKRDLKTHFNRAKANGWLPTFEAQAKRTNYPVEVLLAIGSRETNMRNIRGDFRNGRYNGYGLMQLDIGSHKEWIESGAWKDPHGVIERGAHALYQKRREVANHAKADGKRLSEYDLLRASIAAYNTGSDRAYPDLKDHNNPDRRTTGKDYSADVLKRAEYFRELLAAEPSRVNTATPETPSDNEISSKPDPASESTVLTPAESTPEPANPAVGGPSPADVVVTTTPVEKTGSKKSMVATAAATLAALGLSTWETMQNAYGAIKGNPVFAISFVATLAAICFIYNRYQARQTELDKQREQQAHEINLAKMRYAADPNSNTVDIKPSVASAPDTVEVERDEQERAHSEGAA